MKNDECAGVSSVRKRRIVRQYVEFDPLYSGVLALCRTTEYVVFYFLSSIRRADLSPIFLGNVKFGLYFHEKTSESVMYSNIFRPRKESAKFGHDQNHIFTSPMPFGKLAVNPVPRKPESSQWKCLQKNKQPCIPLRKHGIDPTGCLKEGRGAGEDHC